MNKILIEFLAVEGRVSLPFEDIGAVAEAPQPAQTPDGAETISPVSIYDKGTENWLRCLEDYDTVVDRVASAGDMAGWMTPPNDPTPPSKETEDD